MRFFLFFTLMISSFCLIQCADTNSITEEEEEETATTEPQSVDKPNPLPDTFEFEGGADSNATRATTGTIDGSVVPRDTYNHYLSINNVVIFNSAPPSSIGTVYYAFQVGGTDILSSRFIGNNIFVNETKSNFVRLGIGIQDRLSQGFSVRVVGTTGFAIDGPATSQSSSYNGIYVRIYFISPTRVPLFYITRQLSGGTNGSLGVQASVQLRIKKGLLANAEDNEIEIDGVTIDLGDDALTPEALAQKIAQASFAEGTVYATSPYTVTATGENINFLRTQRGVQGNGSISIQDPSYSYE